jgi:uncharacterized membrane protein
MDGERQPLSSQLTGPWMRLVPARLQRKLWAPAAVILTLAGGTLVAGWVQKSPCLHTTPTWAHGLPFRYACYSDVIPLYGAEGFEEEAFPYQHSWIEEKGKPTEYKHYMEYPVLTGMYMWAGAELTHGYLDVAKHFVYLPRSIPNNVYFNIMALGASVFWLLTVAFVIRITRRRVWDGVLLAVCPIVIVQAFTNFDLLAVALATGAVLAWSRRRPALAGVLIGLGTAAKLYPVLFLIPILVLCLRTGKLKPGLRATFAAIVSWEVVNAPIVFLFPHGWLEFLRLNSTRGADPDSLYNVVAQFTGWGGFDGPLAPHQTPTELNAVVAVLLIACLAAVAWIALSAPRRPRLAQLLFLVVSAFLITNKVWSPQYSLWLVPLAVLAVPRWKPLLAWMLIDTWLWVARMYFYLPSNEGGWGQNPFLITVCVRDFAVACLCALVIYEIYHPARDLVRQSGDDDPAGGVLDGADDALVLRGLHWRRTAPALSTPA